MATTNATGCNKKSQIFEATNEGARSDAEARHSTNLGDLFYGWQGKLRTSCMQDSILTLFEILDMGILGV